MREAQIEVPEPGVYSAPREDRSSDACIEESAGGLPVTIGGHRLGVTVRNPRGWSPQDLHAAPKGVLSVAAPMPGKAVRLLVAAGGEVAGWGLLVVEAMNVQNELKAPRAGRVVTLAVHEGSTVAAGEILAAIHRNGRGRVHESRPNRVIMEANGNTSRMSEVRRYRMDHR
jgi:biotin carboxyl carrier protein